MRCVKFSRSATCVVFLLSSNQTYAHAFGQRYDLPLPLWLFMTGAAAAVLVSFLMAILLKSPKDPSYYNTFELGSNVLAQCVLRVLAITLQIFGVILLVLVIVAGIVGDPSPKNNISPVMFWIISWVGLAYLCALFGNVWNFVNPWKSIYLWAEWSYKKLYPGAELSRNISYPYELGAWPAFVFFFIFAWLELVWSEASIPRNISIMLVCYSILTFAGMYCYGRESWLRNGEFFSMIYSLFSRVSPVEIGDHDGRIHLRLRPPVTGLGTTESEAPSFSLVFFILLLLSTVTYDGFTETKLSHNTYKYIAGWLGESSNIIVDTLGMVCFAIFFMQIYRITMILIAWVGGRLDSIEELASNFILSLVPIAIAYHLSHYLSLLLIEGQLVIRNISDPFGFGWDLFGTADFQVDITILNAKFVWYFSVINIVLGHIAAVYLAHRQALWVFPNRRSALISQIPMLGLMVGYTMVSLWIIAQPIVM